MFLPYLLHSQNITIITGGALKKGETALVTGDYVRIRSGSSLKHRIITKVNRGTVVTILGRGDDVEQVDKMKNYWYHIKIEKSGIEGWIYGEFLNKREEEPLKTVITSSEKEIGLREIGVIPQNAYSVFTGDLNNNGTEEIILLTATNNGRSSTILGYEPDSDGFTEIYTINLRNTSINTIKIFTHPVFDMPVIAAESDKFSYLYSYDIEKRIPRLLYKLDSPMISLGVLDGINPYLVSLRKNKILDNDGTITYYIQAEKIEYIRKRITLKDKVQYQRPLPVKKLLTFDLDGDKKEEIITEIGGNEFGGGITVLKFSDTGIVRLLNTGVNTYNDSQFVSIWGVNFEGKPKLFIYSTDPSKNSDVNTSFGFISASLHTNNIVIDKFYPVNKMLDDVNNYRKVAAYKTDDRSFPFIVLDYNDELEKYTVKRAVLN